MNEGRNKQMKKQVNKGMDEWYGTEASTTWKEKFELDHPLCQVVVIMDAPVFSQGYKKKLKCITNDLPAFWGKF